MPALRPRNLPVVPILAIAFLTAVPALRAEVVIRRFHEPLPELDLSSAETKGSVETKGNEPSDGTWFVPLFQVDTRTTAFASSTFYSIRNEGDVPVNVLAEYFTRILAPPRQQAERFRLDPHQVVSVNVRDVEDLAVDADGFARGLIRIIPPLESPISVDAFQVDARNNFATGSPAFLFPDDFCTHWQVRFLRFPGTSGGSVMTVLVNGPRGSGNSAPDTLVGTVFRENGTAVNNFAVKTDQWALEVPLLDLVEDDEVSFGSIELTINASSAPRGVVAVAHNAQNRFSVGAPGICRDAVVP